MSYYRKIGERALRDAQRYGDAHHRLAARRNRQPRCIWCGERPQQNPIIGLCAPCAAEREAILAVLAKKPPK